MGHCSQSWDYSQCWAYSSSQSQARYHSRASGCCSQSHTFHCSDGTGSCCRRCGICKENKPVDDYRGATVKSQTEYCSRCMHYVNQLASKSSSSKSKYTVKDIKAGHKVGTVTSYLPTSSWRYPQFRLQFSASADLLRGDHHTHHPAAFMRCGSSLASLCVTVQTSSTCFLYLCSLYHCVTYVLPDALTYRGQARSVFQACCKAMATAQQVV